MSFHSQKSFKIHFLDLKFCKRVKIIEILIAAFYFLVHHWLFNETAKPSKDFHVVHYLTKLGSRVNFAFLFKQALNFYQKIR